MNSKFMFDVTRPAMIFAVILFVISLHIPVQAADWNFQEIIVDENPPQPARITDCTIVDINGDGRPDIWYAARKGSRNEKDHFMPWYENTGDMNNWVRHLSFAGPSCYGTWADVDGDGDMDLIASKDRKQSLQWMQNPLKEGADPRKGPWNIYQIYPGEPMDPDEVHASYVGSDSRIHHNLDMNGDGRLDFVVAKYDGPVYYIPTPANPKTPSGSWTFYEIGESGGTARLADLDHDGDIDVAVQGRWHGNPGDPTKPWETFAYGEFPGAAKVAIGDIDGDGRLDIVLSGEESEQGVAWFHNPGGDARKQWDRYIVIAPNTGWKGLHSLEVADFDHDADLDILTAQMHGRPGQRVAVVENVDGKGKTWQPHVLSHCGTHNAKVGDIDGDGDPDIVGKNYEDDKRPRIWINPNSERPSLDNWQRHIIDSDNLSRYTILAADLDRDGRPDIVTGTAWYQNRGTAGGTWQRQDLGADLGNAMLIYDFDRDKDLDVLGEGFGWAKNDGQGSFKLLKNIAAKGGFLQGFGVGLFKPELPIQVVYTHKNGDNIHLLTVPADPSKDKWQDRVIYDWMGKSKCIDLGDIDRDGDLDIMFTGRDAPTIQWLRNEADGSFKPFDLAETPAEINHRCHLGDINADGRLDVVIGHKGKLVTWFEQPNSATSKWTKHIIADAEKLTFDPLSLDVADMDGDGDLDVIVGEHTPDQRQASQCSLFIFESTDGSGTIWTRHTIYNGDEHHQGAQAADIDRDGDVDIISVGWTHNRVTLYENKTVTN